MRTLTIHLSRSPVELTAGAGSVWVATHVTRTLSAACQVVVSGCSNHRRATVTTTPERS